MQKILPRSRLKFSQTSLVVGAVALAGAVVIWRVFAAGTPVAFEAESGVVAGSAVKQTLSGASGGSAVKFGSGLTDTGQTLNGHNVLVDSAGKLVAWSSPLGKAYDYAAFLSMDYLLHKVPDDPSTGKPAYLSRSKLDAGSQTVMNWPSNPAGMFGMIIDSSVKYYAYSGNNESITLARSLADHMIASGLTPASDNWGSVPNSSGEWGSLTYYGSSYGDGHNGQGDGTGVIQPDKIGEMGVAFMQLYRITGDTRYRDAAITGANELVEHIRTGSATQSPWPYRVKASNNNIVQQYGANVLGPIRLFDNLIALNAGNVASYQTARTTAMTWLMNFPIKNNKWNGYFEDMPNDPNITNNNQLNAGNMAIYLMRHPEMDPDWETHTRGIISFIESTYGDNVLFSALPINEQTDFNDRPMGSHTSRYATVNALLYEKTGDTAAKEKAYRSYNWATYMARSNGVVIDSPVINEIWFTDGYGDFIKHFMMGMGAVPEWAPFGETHLLETSGEVIKNVSYTATGMTYKADSGSGMEVIRVTQEPAAVTLDGFALAKRNDLNAQGWTYDALSSVVRVKRTSGSDVGVAY